MAETQTSLYFDRLMQLLLRAKKELAGPVEVSPEVLALGQTALRPGEVQTPTPPPPVQTPQTGGSKPTPKTRKKAE